METQLRKLAQVLEIDEEKLRRHLLRPLAPPVKGSLDGWNAPPDLQRLHDVCDGLHLFSKETWSSFALLDAQEYARLRAADDDIYEPSRALGVVPIFGDWPHYTSVRVQDGAVVATDWEDQDGEGWLKPIAPSIARYVATLILVREAYGLDEDPEAMPSDWWHPYAAHGARYDRGEYE